MYWHFPPDTNPFLVVFLLCIAFAIAFKGFRIFLLLIAFLIIMTWASVKFGEFTPFFFFLGLLIIALVGRYIQQRKKREQ